MFVHTVGEGEGGRLWRMQRTSARGTCRWESFDGARLDFIPPRPPAAAALKKHKFLHRKSSQQIGQQLHRCPIPPRGRAAQTASTMGAARSRASCSSSSTVPQSTTGGATHSASPANEAKEAKDASSPLFDLRSLRSEDLVPAMLFAWPIIAAAAIGAFVSRPSPVRSSVRSARRL